MKIGRGREREGGKGKNGGEGRGGRGGRGEREGGGREGGEERGREETREGKEWRGREVTQCTQPTFHTNLCSHYAISSIVVPAIHVHRASLPLGHASALTYPNNMTTPYVAM